MPPSSLPLRVGQIIQSPGSTSHPGFSGGSSPSKSVKTLSKIDKQLQANEKFLRAYSDVLDEGKRSFHPIMSINLEEDINKELKNNLDGFEFDLERLSRASVQLNIPPDSRKEIIQDFYARFFYHNIDGMKDELKKEMVRSTVHPKSILKFNGRDLSFFWQGKKHNLNPLIEAAKKGGISIKEIHKVIKGIKDELMKTNAHMVGVEFLVGVRNYYKFMVPCDLQFNNYGKCLSWKQVLPMPSENWKEDIMQSANDLKEEFYHPLKRGVARFIHVF